MKDVPDFESEYSASTEGFIFSKRMNRFLTQNSKGWYLNIKLCKNGIKYPDKVHRIIAKTFIPNPLNLLEINHKNGIKTDNRVDNLEWVSRSQNIRHAFSVLKRVPVTGERHPKTRPIIDLNTGIFYFSTYEAAHAKGLVRNSVKCRLYQKKECSGLVYA